MNNLHRGFYVLNLFHTIEFMLCIGLLGLIKPVFFYALAGALWHCALDFFMLARRRLIFIRALSIAEYYHQVPQSCQHRAHTRFAAH